MTTAYYLVCKYCKIPLYEIGYSGSVMHFDSFNHIAEIMLRKPFLEINNEYGDIISFEQLKEIFSGADYSGRDPRTECYEGHTLEADKISETKGFDDRLIELEKRLDKLEEKEKE